MKNIFTLIITLSMFSSVFAQSDTTFFNDYLSLLYKFSISNDSKNIKTHYFIDSSTTVILDTTMVLDSAIQNQTILHNVYSNLYNNIRYEKYEDFSTSEISILIDGSGKIIQVHFLKNNDSRCSDEGRWITNLDNLIEIPLEYSGNYIELTTDQVIFQCYCICDELIEKTTSTTIDKKK